MNCLRSMWLGKEKEGGIQGMDAGRKRLLFWVWSINSDPEMFRNYKPNVPRPHLCGFRVPSTFITVGPQHLANISLHRESFREPPGWFKYIKKPVLCCFYTQHPQYIHCFWKLLWTPQPPLECFLCSGRKLPCLGRYFLWQSLWGVPVTPSILPTLIQAL